MEAAFDATYNGWPTTTQYLVKADGSAALVHTIQVQNEAVNSWFEVYVDAHSGEIVSVTDFVAEATVRYLRTFRFYFSIDLSLSSTKSSPLQSVPPLRDSKFSSIPRILLPPPLDGTLLARLATPPLSMLNAPLPFSRLIHIHRGNNVISYKTSTTGTTAQSATGLVFNYTYDDTLAPTVTANLNAARVNAFYLINTVHDLAYRYGFTEASYNFQTDNGSKGGKGADPVKISVQDSSGTNNANFATPAEYVPLVPPSNETRPHISIQRSIRNVPHVRLDLHHCMHSFSLAVATCFPDILHYNRSSVMVHSRTTSSSTK